MVDSVMSENFPEPGKLEEIYERALANIRERMKTAHNEFQKTLEEVMSDEWEGNGFEKWLFGDSAEFDRRREWQKAGKYAIFAM